MVDSNDKAKEERETVIGPNDFNEKVIAEFHANDGEVGPPFQGAPLLLLTTTGAKSGKLRTTPLVYLADGNRYIIFASAAGSDHHPSWYHNLVAHPRVTIEVGKEKFDSDVTILEGTERDEIFNRQKELRPDFASYEQATSRIIPVVALTKS